jgi:cobalt-zinc-cadmium efflux system outer membrane protein
MRLAILFLSCMAAQALTLRDLENMALRGNPSLPQAAAAARSAEAMRRQAGLYPNPMVGYTADEVNGGSVFNYGEHGVFLEQRIVTGGKLGIAKKVAEQSVAQSEAERAAQHQRVLNAVRSLYYQALGEQRLLETRKELAAIAARTVQTTRELQNIGMSDRPDALAMEVEAQRIEVGLTMAQNALDRTWRQLAAVTGNPELKPAPLEGNIEELPKLSFDESLAKLLAESPELKIAETQTARSTLAVDQAKKAVVPDLVVRGGAHYNKERLETNNRAVGWQASAEVGIELPIFNRNQGAIAAAKADAERARFAVERARLDLRSRLAAAFREYQDAVAAAERYRDSMIPKAKEAHELYLRNFRQMATAYPNVLSTQRSFFQLQEEYAQALVMAWQRAVEIQGLLVTE